MKGAPIVVLTPGFVFTGIMTLDPAGHCTVSPEIHIHVLTLVLTNVTLFGNTVFAAVIRLRWDYTGEAPDPVPGILIEHKRPQGKECQDCQQPLNLGEAGDSFSPGASRRSPPSLHFGSGFSAARIGST